MEIIDERDRKNVSFYNGTFPLFIMGLLLMVLAVAEAINE
jgi:hypothetical protein